MTSQFSYLITLTPLGLLYGSTGRFLSPENLVGRSGAHFPPSAATLSGIFAAQLAESQPDQLKDLYVAGPFWSWQSNPQDFCVPTPMNCLAKFSAQLEADQIPEARFEDALTWHETPSTDDLHWLKQDQTPPAEKYSSGTWTKISDWPAVSSGQLEQITAYGDPWQFLPHLHPSLEKDQRRVDVSLERGSLFLENGVQLHSEVCLTYLANQPLPDGWYRFGGEGHMVELVCHDLSEQNNNLLNESSLERSFAIITPAIWGSNRLSARSPRELKKGDASRHSLEPVDKDLSNQWQVDALLTQKAVPTRYRLGNSQPQPPGEGASSYSGSKSERRASPKSLSRGRYAVPAGSVYILSEAFGENRNAWHKWPEEWFPKEGPSLKRWGCGLALPLECALA